MMLTMKLIGGSSIFLALSAHAYEQTTHAAISAAAVMRSELASSGTLLAALGLGDPVSLGPLRRYFEIVDPAAGALGASARRSQDYEDGILDELRVFVGPAPQAWILRGAIREDDNPNEQPPTPQDVSPNVKRPLHHFFDPLNNKPLTVGVPFGQKNPDWAIGSSDSFNQLNTPQKERLNHFSLFDAREAMFRALTLKWKSQDAQYPELALGQVDPETKELWRKAYWATTFRALGDALHLVQDMAQPQHTRNEPHSGFACLPFTSLCAGGEVSVYEKYIDARVRGRKFLELPDSLKEPLPIGVASLEFGSYPVPAFNKYTDFWSTSPGPGSYQGKGLADYSNRGFFTAARNYDTSDYPSPEGRNFRSPPLSSQPTRWDGTAIVHGAPVYVLEGYVRDTYEGGSASIALTSYGLWDQFLLKEGRSPRFTLNRVNYDGMASLLIPRAVAYSAGLINYFFRGRLNISRPTTGVYGIVDHARIPSTDLNAGFKTLTLNLRNATSISSGTDQPDQMTGGTLFAVLKFHRNICYAADLKGQPGGPRFNENCRLSTEEIVVSEPKNFRCSDN